MTGAPMSPADDPHLVERIARLAVFHELPMPVVVQMTLMASVLMQRAAGDVHEEVERRIASLKARAGRPALRVVVPES
jgi:hypothetical protein